MQLSEIAKSHRVFQPKVTHKNSSPLSTGSPGRSHHDECHEIHTYIAIRDNFLSEAEKDLNVKNLDRANAANNFVATCLFPVRSPYEAQYLPETEAIEERKRCEAVKARVAALRAKLALATDHSQAA